MYSRNGMAVTGCLKPSFSRLDTGLVFGVCMLFSWCVQAQETIEILYEQTDSPTQRGGSWWWLINLLLILGLAGLLWLYFNTRKSLKEKELALERTAERLQEAQTIARIGSWERDFESGETFWSSEAKEVLGFARNMPNLRHYEALVHPDDLEMVTETMASAYFKGGSYQCDHRVVCGDGREKYIRLAGKVFLGEGIGPVRETGTVQDITERKLAELALQANEHRSSSILDAVPYPLIIMEAGDRHTVLYSNEGARMQFQLNPLSATKEFDTAAMWKDADACQELLACLQQQRLLELEMELIDRNGDSFWAMVTANKMDFGGTRAILLTVMNISERKQIEQKLDRLITLDSLTGALNRRSFFECAEKESRRAQRYNQSFALLVMGVDAIKSVIDAYGHEFGDRVLERFCVLIRSVLREEDILGRLGDEEFCVLLVASDHENSRLAAERIRKSWQMENFAHHRKSLSFTVSIGVALQARADETLMQIVERADRCFQKAKQAGCNQVVLSSDPKVSAGLGR